MLLGSEVRVMKRSLFKWLLSVAFGLGFMASVSHADMLAIRCILGLPGDMVSEQTPFAQFAIDRPYDTPHPFATDKIVGNSVNESLAFLSPATDQGVKAFPSAGNFTMVIMVSVGENLCENNVETGIAPAKLLQAVSGRSEDVGTTTIVLEVRFPMGFPGQIAQRGAAGGLRLISPEPAGFTSAREPVSLRDYTVPIELARARGPVK
jgi:hypothetical protein